MYVCTYVQGAWSGSYLAVDLTPYPDIWDGMHQMFPKHVIKQRRGNEVLRLLNRCYKNSKDS